ncbi:MAG: 30S ribosomal protein S20 [Arenicellales bacterium WSBS_2016_MAG_OTU3]
MANSPQARKRARQSAKSRLHNMAQRSAMRTRIKAFLKAIKNSDKDAAAASLQSAVSIIDKNARRGLQHANKAARLKSRLSKRLQALNA